MRRLHLHSFVITLFVALIVPFGAAAAPPPRDPGSGGDDGDATLAGDYELPALTLTPEDVDEPGFGITGSQKTTLESDAAAINGWLSGTDDDLADVQDQIEEAGWVQGFSISMAVESGDDPEVYATAITNILTEFSSDGGAADYYDLLNEANATTGFRKANGGEPVGDESIYTRWSGDASDGRPLNYLDVVFRSGAIVGEIYTAEYSDDRPDIEAFSPMANAVVERISQAERSSGPGLSWRALLLEGKEVSTYYGYYNRLNDVQIPAYGRSSADSRAEDEFYRDEGVLDVYISSQSMTVDDDGFLDFLTYLYRFESAEKAGDAVGNWADNWEQAPSEPYIDVERVDDAEIVGDDSVTLAHTLTLGEESDAEGLRVFLQVDDVVVSAIVNSSVDVELDLFEEISQAAADCISDEPPCPTFEITEDQIIGD